MTSRPQRLQKILSAAGIVSRRAAEGYILQGRVTVNGVTVTQLGSKADPEVDDVRVDGRRIRSRSHRIYILLNKPSGYITSRSDPQRRPTVIDLLRSGGVEEYVYPVGRLDFDSEGLLILTSDGDLAARLTHPRHGIAREYRVQVRGVPDRAAVERLRRGVVVDGRRTAPADARLERVVPARGGEQAILSIALREGRNQQIRKMCDAIGHPVVQLRRVRIGPVSDPRLRPGQFRPLTAAEIATLKAAVRRPATTGAPMRGAATRPAGVPRTAPGARSRRT